MSKSLQLYADSKGNTQVPEFFNYSTTQSSPCPVEPLKSLKSAKAMFGIDALIASGTRTPPRSSVAQERVPPVYSHDRSDATRRGRRGYFARRAERSVGHRSRRSATLPPTQGRVGSRPAALAKTDCGVARYSGRRSHIGLCQTCACEASAFQDGHDGVRPSRIQQRPFGRHAPRAARVLRAPGRQVAHRPIGRPQVAGDSRS